MLYWDHVTIVTEQQAFGMQQKLSYFYSGLDEAVERLTSSERKQKQLSVDRRTASKMDEAFL